MSLHGPFHFLERYRFFPFALNHTLKLRNIVVMRVYDDGSITFQSKMDEGLRRRLCVKWLTREFFAHGGEPVFTEEI